MAEIFEEGQFSDAEEEEVTCEKTQVYKTATNEGKSASFSSPMTSLVEVATKLKIVNSEDDLCESDIESDTHCDWDEDNMRGNTVVKTNAQTANNRHVSSKVANYQPMNKLLRRYADKINMEKYEGPSLSNYVVNVLIENNKRTEKGRIRTKDKQDRATVEQVLDTRTKMILFKLLNKGLIARIDGCISTGKEANVYYALSATGTEVAIKIYKTSILQFRDRDKYVNGEFRFRHGYSKHNPRKMVRTWAEKEMRNLVRLQQAGISAPKPILLRSHVLLMDFIGAKGWASPKLKDVVLTASKLTMLYRECIEMMWKMYNKCRLVHADLSEYNMLYHNGSLVIIDVSQSVEHDHPMALEFLRKDCTNITEFFKKHNVAVMTVKELFDFITDPTINENNMDEYLDVMDEKKKQKADQESDFEEQVFKQAYIPQSLVQVIDFERDINLAKSGKENLIYKTLIGLKTDLSKPAEIPEILAARQCKDDDNDTEEDYDDSESDNGNDSDEVDDKHKNVGTSINIVRRKDESPESKKARKKAVKEEQAKKRKNKIKKHVKKRKTKKIK
ncbi:serine/threonine-protein kinase RIO1 isoform X2 [Odontomachus brunneus]|uniref:serine/threonine-protein kinase RIO1 isoform X2 n=1 Tax=Odontomachus brunneus TaxID=486640 RepID=UPI0013F184BC|nr:serine/threonine-protein kinase RIO1 isoform X2 [Odontomachus brunneus]XP_032666347.1 serine/threonine-protein kinase RIO1 isoform X2 [Odontomachus brunneus]XP_032666348.1 serine/threonine-protein kinase RIO1 isoform X2 [Odontomachus brunneus]